MSQTVQPLLDALVAISRTYGRDPSFVLAGGGNTSAKQGERLWVKGSGAALATITADDFVVMHRPALEQILRADFGDDRVIREERFKEAVLAARVEPGKGQRPSVEVVLHHLMPGRLVVHTHATIVNMFACCVQGESLLRDLCGDQVLWIEDVDPGLVLARTLRDRLREYVGTTGRDSPRAVVMQNHGLVVAGDTPDQIRRRTDWLIETLSSRLGESGLPTRAARRSGEEDATPMPAPPRIRDEDGEGPSACLPRRSRIRAIAPALRGLLAGEDGLKVVSFDDSPPVMDLVAHPQGRMTAEGGPLTPDQVVYCRSLPLWVRIEEASPGRIVTQLRDAVADYRERTGLLPQVVLVQDVGMFTAGDDHAAADTTRRVYLDAIRVMAGAARLGAVRYLRQSQREFFENWEAEAYRRRVARGQARAGRAAGKIAFVTGAAQGFGLEIARDLADQGAHVVLADINAAGAARAAQDICAARGAGRAMGLPIDVTRGDSVEEAIHQAVRLYGGCDLFVSNAGVLRAGSVKTQPQEDFEFVTAVNYQGYFVCVQKIAPVMAAQHLARPDSWSDIIQINSKSGLEGSNRNGAYAGSKFGGIGLTQSFALELVEDRIKVNAICPGNFFDGPLWSDPADGLFVQYLRSGKVPGAKTVEDVRRFYEAKVPMGRGCATADVMKAIYYLMEQTYETGQAVPVTGGQVMLG